MIRNYDPLLLLFSCFLLSCSKNKESQEGTRPVKVTEVTLRKEVKRDFSGVVDAVKYANLAFRVSGQIIDLPVVVGQKVKKGDLIAQIDPREIQLKLDAAKAQFETNQATLSRNQRLLEEQAVSQQEYEIAQANYEQAKSNYMAQQNNMTDTYLRAPYDGSIAKRSVENYQRVNMGQTVVEIIDSHDLQIIFTIPDTYLPYIQSENKSFTVEFSLYRGIKFTASLIEYVEASLDGSGIPVYLKITDPRFTRDKYDIKPGFSCNVSMTIYLKSKNIDLPFIPLTAIFGIGTDPQMYVWVVRNNTVFRQPITTVALTEESSILVSSGLQPGDIIVTAGTTRLTEGEKIKILH